MEMFSTADRVSIYSRPLNTSPLEEVWCNGELGQIPGLDGERVQGTLEKWKRTILIEDARTDKLLKGVDKRRFLSCLAVPVLDESRDLKGLIYLTSPDPKGFNTHGRFACEKMAKEVAPVLHRLHKSGGDIEQDDRRAPFDFLYSRRFLLGVGVLVLFGGFAILSRPTESVSEPTGDSKSPRVGPREVSKTFLQHLRVGEFNQAWELLTPDLQKSWSRAQFQDSLQNWAASEAHQLVLLNREVAGVKVEQGVARAVLFGTTVEGDDGVQWEWELVEVDRRWRLSRVGGPVAIR